MTNSWTHSRCRMARHFGYRRLSRTAMRTCLALAAASIALQTARAGLIISPIWDGTITGDARAATIEASINSVIQIYDSAFQDPITVSIKFQEGGGLGASSTYYGTISYSSYRTALVADATTAIDAQALAHLPGGPNNPVDGNANINVTTANLRALGLSGNPGGNPDSTITLNTAIMNLDRVTIDPQKYDLMAVAAHEIDEALGFNSALNGALNGSASPAGAVWGMDLYRYLKTSTTRSFDTNINTLSAFSLNGGTTDLAQFNQDQNGDFSDLASASPLVQNAFGTPGATPNPGVELTMLDALGYTPAAATPEPSTGLLLGVTLLFAAGIRRLRNR